VLQPFRRQTRLDVIENVKKTFLGEIASSLPGSVRNRCGSTIAPNLINAAIETLKHTLLEEKPGWWRWVCIVFLLHVRQARWWRSSMLPVGILMAFGAMKLLGLGANIMSLGGNRHCRRRHDRRPPS